MADIVEILGMAKEKNATDVYLIAGRPPLLRKGEKLIEFGDELLDPTEVHSMVDELFNDEQRERFKARDEIDFSFAIPQVGRFRVNAYWQRSTPAAVLRVIPERVPKFEDLGLPDALRDLAASNQGLLLVTGPTGSGKSTTLAAIVDYISRHQSHHIITIEDPVEYQFDHGLGAISQREVGTDTHSFHEALLAALRQAPRVIMVGEMRDRITMDAALTAAETGHLVLGTLHTKSSYETVDRLVNAFEQGQQQEVRTRLASTLLAIMAQQLVPTTDGEGIALAYELLIATPAVRALIRDGKSHQIPSTIATNRDIGMIGMDTSLANLVRQNIISEETGRKYAINLVDFENQLKQAATGNHAWGSK